MAKKTKSKIQYGDKDLLSPDEFDPRKSKVLISIRLDGDVLDSIKRAAAEKGVGYQTFINDSLRHTYLDSHEPDLSDDEKRKIRAILDRQAVAAVFVGGGALCLPDLKTGT